MRKNFENYLRFGYTKGGFNRAEAVTRAGIVARTDISGGRREIYEPADDEPDVRVIIDPEISEEDLISALAKIAEAVSKMGIGSAGYQGV